MKIGYCLERVGQYVPTPLRCFKWQKYGHYREACRVRRTCAKCGKKDPDHLQEDCLKQIKWANCRQNHPAYVRSCVVYKKEKEILEVKHKRNVSSLEARKIIATYMGENNYASGKIQMNTKVYNQKLGSAFKMPSRTKSPVGIKQCNDQGSKKKKTKNL